MPQRPNILFLLSDEHGFRYVSHRAREAGGEPVRTPALDGLAARGVNFDAAYCQSPLCTPSRLCLFTGREQHRCGAWGNSAVLRPGLPTLPGHLAEAGGYETCLVGKLHFGGNRQYAGFRHRPYGDFGGPCSHQRDPLRPRHEASSMRRRTLDAGLTELPESLLQEQVIVRESLAFLREQRHRAPQQPWFLCASFSRPHFPLTAPRRHFERYWPQGVTPPRVGKSGDSVPHPMSVGMMRGFEVDQITLEEQQRARAAYFACVDYLDEVLGDFLALLERGGFLEHTVVIYSSDHGEMAGEHGLWWKNCWHEAAMRVPWLWQLPEHRAGTLAPREVRSPVSLADLFPTCCALAGIEPPGGLDGRDLSAFLQGEPGATRGAGEHEGVRAEFLAPRWGPGTEFRLLREGRYKYVAFRNAPELLFDLEADPGEQHNLAARPLAAVRPVLERMRQTLFKDFDWDAAEAERRRDEEENPERFPRRAQCLTPNQIQLPDGRLVEADTPLYEPRVVTENPREAFSDHPENSREHPA